MSEKRMILESPKKSTQNSIRKQFVPELPDSKFVVSWYQLLTNVFNQKEEEVWLEDLDVTRRYSCIKKVKMTMLTSLSLQSFNDS